MATKEITGICVALIKPFKNNTFEIDFDTLNEHIDRLVDAGVHGLVPGGSTGEFTALSIDERKQLLEAVIKSANRRVGVMAVIGDLSTSKTVELAKHAADSGASSLMVVPPFLHSTMRPTWRSSKSIYQRFTRPPSCQLRTTTSLLPPESVLHLLRLPL